jgi:hypothetical protein
MTLVWKLKIIIIILLAMIKNQVLFMMRKRLMATTVGLLSIIPAYSQPERHSGTPIVELFTDFHVSLDDTTVNNGFDLKRAYFGYRVSPVDKFFVKVILNAGQPEDMVAGSKMRRYAFFREASLSWSNERLTITAGLTSTRLFEFQQRFWGKRYVAPTFQLINNYGYDADIGIVVDYQVNNTFRADITLMNGEGFCNPVADDKLKVSMGMTVTPGDNLAMRVHGEIQDMEGSLQPLFSGFIGYKNKYFRAGGEVICKSNMDSVKGHHGWGISTTGGIHLTEKTELFGRYDYSASVTSRGESVPWNRSNDGSFMIAGIEYSFSPDIRVALNYQSFFPREPSRNPTGCIYLNTVVRF